MPKTSVEEFIDRQEAQIALEEAGYESLVERKITLRINLAAYVRIKMLAQRYGHSPTSCATALLEAAAIDAYEASPLTEQELQDAIGAEV